MYSLAALKFVEGALSSDEVYCSYVVGSVLVERGIKVFDDIVRSVTKKHLGVFWEILYSILTGQSLETFLSISIFM